MELAELDCAQSIAGGDFNCILDPHIDKTPAEGTNPTKQARATVDVCEELGDLDVWRALNPNNKELTFFSGVHKSSSRIDYLFVPKTMLYSVSSCKIGTVFRFTYISHMEKPSNNRANGGLIIICWMTQISYIFFQTEFQIFFSWNSTTDVSLSILWETCKAYSHGLILTYEKKKHKMKATRRATEIRDTAFCV